MSRDDKLATLRQKPNVVGYDKQLRKRIRDGVEVEEEVIQVFVSMKVPLAQLSDADKIPDEIDGIPVDVIDLGGEVTPNLFTAQPAEALSAVGNRDRTRPIVPGISLGNINITAGTFGWVYDKGGELFGGSNAHVLHELPASPLAPKSPHILQPGSLDGGKMTDLVGSYVWHNQIVPETPLAIPEPPCNWWCRFVRNFTGYTPPPAPVPTVPTPMNKQDFATFKINDTAVDYGSTYDFDVLDEDRLIGLIYAGTPIVSMVTKVKYQLEKGYTPLNVKTAHVDRFDNLFKSGRTTGYTGKIPDELKYVLSDSIVIKVNYGQFYGWFDDVIMVNRMSEGGDSGSPVFKRVE